ncbi:transposase [Pseudoalteromonas sp. SG44-1]|nr:transposase [Pseudoalteromonas sp. SG44-1]
MLAVATDEDHIHFLVQLVLTYSITQLVTIIRSLTVREVFKSAFMLKSSCLNKQLTRF